MAEFDYEEFRKWEEVNQYYLPKKNVSIAEQYGDKLTYNDMIHLYQIAVSEVLIFYNVKTLSEIGFGQGYLEATQRWIEKIKYYIKVKNND